MVVIMKISRNSVFLGSDKPRMIMYDNCWYFNIYEQGTFHAYKVKLMS